MKSILLTRSDARILAFHICQAVTLVKIDFISSWISAGKVRAFDAPQISAMKILLLLLTGSTEFYVFERYNLVSVCFKIF